MKKVHCLTFGHGPEVDVICRPFGPPPIGADPKDPFRLEEAALRPVSRTAGRP
ncbi:MAG: hypothetical protein ABII06_11895 [Pseudomonadota bacterium]